MSPEWTLVAATAASLGALHALLGPDHYLPFVALGKASGWSLGRTLGITLACGAGHVAASILLGALGILAGWSLGSLAAFDAARAGLAGWLLIGFGLAYAAWGMRDSLRRRPHRHWHRHADGTVHSHQHVHRGGHAHPHGTGAVTPWVLFVLLVLGPCETLIPLLMVPASRGSWSGVALVAGAFGAATLLAMAGAVAVGSLGLARLRVATLERWSHPLAGAALVACGLAVRFGL